MHKVSQTEMDLMSFEKELAELQDAFAMVDLLMRPPRRGDSAVMKLLLKKLLAIKIRMDGNDNHKRPHVHVDYGKHHHVASYAIDTGERLVGNLNRKYDRAVQEWIAEHTPKLLEAWNQMQAGKCATAIACELRGDEN
jgi:Domain of unknown function (DUF4160)